MKPPEYGAFIRKPLTENTWLTPSQEIGFRPRRHSRAVGHRVSGHGDQRYRWKLPLWSVIRGILVERQFAKGHGLESGDVICSNTFGSHFTPSKGLRTGSFTCFLCIWMESCRSIFEVIVCNLSIIQWDWFWRSLCWNLYSNFGVYGLEH